MKQVLANYTFNTSAKTVTMTDFSVGNPLVLERIFVITDVTTNQILYNFGSSANAAGAVTATISSGNVITLSALPGGVANSDSLQVIYEVDPTDPVAEPAQTIIRDPSGNQIATDTYNSVPYLHVDPSYAATDNAVYGSTTVPQIGVVAGKGTDGNVHPIRLDAAGNQDVNTQGLAANALPAATSLGSVVAQMSDKFGRQVFIPQGMRDIQSPYSAIITNSTAPATIVPAVASTYCDITSIIIVNTSSSPTLLTLSDGTNSYYLYAPPNDMRGATYQVPLPATSTNTVWTLTCATAVSSIYVTTTYVRNN